MDLNHVELEYVPTRNDQQIVQEPDVHNAQWKEDSAGEVERSKTPQLSTRVQEYTDVVLEFLSNASTEALGACVVALCASTYLVLGRVGLVLIGTVGGIALHAAWEYNGHERKSDAITAAEGRRRREVSLDVVHRVLEWRQMQVPMNNAKDSVDSDAVTEKSTKAGPHFEAFQPSTKAALLGLVDAVIRDYVK